MMCCEPVGSADQEVGKCPECGGPIDYEGDSTEVCGYSPEICEECGWAPCEGSC